jgi:hypothetical protein
VSRKKKISREGETGALNKPKRLRMLQEPNSPESSRPQMGLTPNGAISGLIFLAKWVT